MRKKKLTQKKSRWNVSSNPIRFSREWQRLWNINGTLVSLVYKCNRRNKSIESTEFFSSVHRSWLTSPPSPPSKNHHPFIFNPSQRSSLFVKAATEVKAVVYQSEKKKKERKMVQMKDSPSEFQYLVAPSFCGVLHRPNILHKAVGHLLGRRLHRRVDEYIVDGSHERIKLLSMAADCRNVSSAGWTSWDPLELERKRKQKERKSLQR